MKPDRGALTESGRITVAALAAASQAVAPGISTKELDEIAEYTTREAGGAPAFLGYRGFPGSVCTSLNGEVVHGIPSERTLEEGDIISLDMGVKINGWYTDSALTVPVGKIEPEAEKLLAVTRQALEVALEQATGGKRTGDLGAAVQNYVEGEGFNVVRDCVGHGIGQRLHEDPSIPNYGTAGTGDKFKKDMVVAIEPMVVAGSWELETASDQWTVKTRDRSLAAHFEETVIITDGKPERVTPLPGVLSGEKSVGKLGKVA